MIRLYWTRFENELSQERFAYELDQLPISMKDQILKFHRWQDAHASLFGKLLLKKALEHLGLNLSLGALSYTNNKRPYWMSSDVDFNISHSGDYVVCLLSDEMRVGIDIEKVANLSALTDFSSQFHEKEWKDIMQSENSLQTFYRYWTKKEALIKADGIGLNYNLKKIDLSDRNSVISLNDFTWFLREVDLSPLYNCAVATSKKLTSEIELEFISFEESLVKGSK